MKYFFSVIFFLFFISNVNASEKEDEKEEFKAWSSNQNQEAILSYFEYVNSRLKEDMDVIDLFIDRHEDARECKKEIFTIPPKSIWEQIVRPLKLLQELVSSEILGEYIILSTFRFEEANKCMGGAKHSKHLNNAAVDFKIAYDEDVEKALCSFWRKNGKRYNMGLGAYGDGYYHIDTSGFRTWGVGYGTKSSVCNVK